MSQPQPASYYPPQPPHSHNKFMVAIIIAVLVTAVVAGGIGYGLGSLGRSLGTASQPAAGFTFLHGTATGRDATQIRFYNGSCYSCAGVLSASIVSGSYSITLRSGNLYSVALAGGSYTQFLCNANPGAIAPTGVDETQNFSC